MLTLRSSPLSPYGRKVKTVAAVLGLSDRLTIVNADTMDESDPVRRDNPLGKIPVLALEDGACLYDSRVIVEYLDHLAGGGRAVPAAMEEKLPVLVGQALADGITDAAILKRYEIVFRPAERHEPRWIEHQDGKVRRGLAALEAKPPAVHAAPYVDAIATACLLEWLDFRFPGTWRDSHPRLVAFLDAFNAAMPGFAQTRPA